jgi:hypothetical protein
VTNANIASERSEVRSTIKDLILNMNEELLPNSVLAHVRAYKRIYAAYHGYEFGQVAPEGAEDEIEKRWDSDHYGMKHLMEDGDRQIHLMFRWLVKVDPIQLPEGLRALVEKYAKLDRAYWALIVRQGSSGPEQMR